MAFDQSTRNRLARFVGEARALLTEEFTRQLQNDYGLDPARGAVTDLARLTQLDDAGRETARILRDTLAHYLAGQPTPTAKANQEALDRIVREQAFTVLNRLCALRMAEARELLIESVAKGYQSRGFQLYARLAGTALGETGDAYRTYLFSLFDEFGVDLAVLFDRFSPQGRLFPRASTLLQLLDAINHPDIDPLWAEDETIGWIYQYFNSKEERKAMRDASQAPRNSRELAVRNQFFTPRYVVEFLTDNTLGRIWYEMTQGQTSLVDSCRYLVRRPNEIFLAEGEGEPENRETGTQGDTELSQEELLRQPVYIPFRPMKDPRTILMLDPACGSMHFGLYAFDLYERIYDEAWEREGERGAKALQRPAVMAPLHERYADKERFLRDVPRLIIEHNIHGIDIDPRAVQIAGLSLWLRAQRGWQMQGIKPQDRPVIRKSNIVCAEPMPGDRGLLEEFLQGLRDDRLEALIRRVLDVPENQRVRATPTMADALCELVRAVWEEMKVSGEAGSLLKIEESLTDAIAKGRAEWEKLPLFRVETFRLTEEKPEVNYMERISGEQVNFWDKAEALVLAALDEYASQAENKNYQRRLFVADAAHGFAFVDLCLNRYDVILMNPPFGEFLEMRIAYLTEKFPVWNKNILCAFIESGTLLLTQGGLLASVIDRSLLNKSTYADFRKVIFLQNDSLVLVLDLGWGVLDANVEVASCILRSQNSEPGFTACLDLREIPSEQKEFILHDLFNKNIYLSKQTFVHSTENFSAFPNHSIIYNMPDGLLTTFSRLKNLKTRGYISYTGHQLQSERHFRNYWEISQKERLAPDGRFCHFYNGGEYSRFAIPPREVVRFGAFSSLASEDFPSYSYRIQNQDKHFRRGVGFGKRGEYLDAHLLPDGLLFSVEGQVFPIENYDTALFLVGLLNSAVASRLLNAFTGQHKYSGYVNLLPCPELDPLSVKKIASYVQEAISIKRNGFRREETCLLFVSPLITESKSDITSVSHLALNVLSNSKHNLVRLNEIIEKIDKLICELFGLSDNNSLSDIRSYAVRFPKEPLPSIEQDSEKLAQIQLSSEIISYSLGVILGRWDTRLATGDKPAQALLDPFVSIPLCPPGTLQNVQGLPATLDDVPDDYPLYISWPGILVDDPGHSEDIEGRVREALRVIWPDRSDAIEQEACGILGVGSLRAYFANLTRFFDDHLKRYSKSRRVAPIYWPLSTPSGSYTLWLYYHRLTDQTLYSCVNDFVEPKLAQVSSQAAELQRRNNRSRQEEKELEQVSDLALELGAFRDELLRIARFWQPNLNDGVQITAAPLWRLFQHRAWQMRLKETWSALEAGDYDWAHLAYSIWPDRVRAKCKTDKSLAIAHDLEHLYVEPIKPVKAKKGGQKKQVDNDEQGELL